MNKANTEQGEVVTKKVTTIQDQRIYYKVKPQEREKHKRFIEKYAKKHWTFRFVRCKSSVVDTSILYSRGDVDTPVRIRIVQVIKLLK